MIHKKDLTEMALQKKLLILRIIFMIKNKESIVAVDSRVKQVGKYLECVGWYDPKPEPSKINIETERVIYWLSVGAQPTETVRSLLRKAGVLQIWHERKLAKAE